MGLCRRTLERHADVYRCGSHPRQSPHDLRPAAVRADVHPHPSLRSRCNEIRYPLYEKRFSPHNVQVGYPLPGKDVKKPESGFMGHVGYLFTGGIETERTSLIASYCGIQLDIFWTGERHQAGKPASSFPASKASLRAVGWSAIAPLASTPR
jgi:hypothetical protein